MEGENSQIPIFFIVGRPRSGTTLLRTLFDAHPNVLVPPECQFIINLFPKYGKIKQWTAAKFESFYMEVHDQWLFDFWPIDHEKVLDELKLCHPESSYGDVCKVIYRNYESVFAHQQIIALGDKNPGYTIYTEKLLKIFPEAKFIHIIRDYRDNFISIRNVEFELPFISLTTRKWKLFIKKFRKAAERNPGTHYELRYEDLAAEPEKYFKELCEFIGIPYSSAAFDFHKMGDAAESMYPKKMLEKYQASLFNKISTKKIGLWKKKLKASEIKSADAVAGRYAELAGYERQYHRYSLLTRIRILPGICFANLLSIATSVVDTFPYKLRTAILIKAPWTMGRIYLFLFNRKKYKEVSLASRRMIK